MWRMLGIARPLATMMLIAITAGVLGFICATGIPILAAAAALAAGRDGSLSWNYSSIIGVLALLAIFRGVLHYIEQRCNHYIAFKLLAHIRDLVFGALRHLAPAKLSGTDSGNLISTVTSDVELLEVFYAHTISPVAIACVIAAVMAVFLGSIHPVLAVITLLGYALVGVVVPISTSHASGEECKRSRDMKGEISSYVLEGLRGLTEVQQYDYAKKRLKELDLRSRELVSTRQRLRETGSRGQAITGALIITTACVELIIGILLSQSGYITTEGAILASVATLSSFGPFVALSNLGSTLQGTLAAARRIFAILDDRPIAPEVTEGASPSFTSIAAKHVDFSYEGHDVLSDVSLKVHPGKIVGITGKSGSGKSTFCRLLMRFWDPSKGNITLSGINLRDVNTSSLRAMEAFVEQDCYLFHDSIRDNLLIARPNATQKELEDACRAASIHDFIEGLPHGYDTMVGELGDTLSGGERQRLGLARAFLHNSPLLLLDEPTSNLDSLNEGQILRALDKQRGKHTVVLISHRLSTMGIADITYSMDSGKMS